MPCTTEAESSPLQLLLLRAINGPGDGKRLPRGTGQNGPSFTQSLRLNRAHSFMSGTCNLATLDCTSIRLPWSRLSHFPIPNDSGGSASSCYGRPASDSFQAIPHTPHNPPFVLQILSKNVPGFVQYFCEEQGSSLSGRVAIRVYPADLLSPVRAWAESHALRVEDEHGSLAGFLRREQIRVADRPGPRGIALYAGTRAIEKRENFPSREDESAVVFTERETELPRLLIDRTGRAAIIKVEMRIVDRLATDPLAQKMFLEVFQLLHEQEPSTKGVIR